MKNTKENKRLTKNKIKKTKYVSKESKNMIKDLDSERIYIDTKLHYFMYMWLAIVIAICTLFGASIHNYTTYTTINMYSVFFVFQFISFVSITFRFFKVYRYDGHYMINHDIDAYMSYVNSLDNIDELMNAHLVAQKKCIINNRNLNNKRNSDLDLLKKMFGYYLSITTLIIIIGIILSI